MGEHRHVNRELTNLFEGDEQQLLQFIENHREPLERHRIVLEDELAIEKQIPIAFAYIYSE
ncbi:hypothetical protein [Brevibacillus reuszeri]|uniref:hypothetical protein n=1 Tax=Brevibacillus reuszeri TaxID=54915 RepID=UPI001F3DB09C|nr:hypothetical protein [Brevibacillus reuszeri]